MALILTKHAQEVADLKLQITQQQTEIDLLKKYEQKRCEAVVAEQKGRAEACEAARADQAKACNKALDAVADPPWYKSPFFGCALCSVVASGACVAAAVR